MSESNEKGDIGESAFVFQSALKGYWTSKSTQDCPYDYILDKKDGKLLRVQCKYRSMTLAGTVVIGKTSFHTRRRSYTSDNIDVFAVYVPELDKVALIPIVDFGDAKEVTFRVTPQQVANKRCRPLEQYFIW